MVKKDGVWLKAGEKSLAKPSVKTQSKDKEVKKPKKIVKSEDVKVDEE